MAPQWRETAPQLLPVLEKERAAESARFALRRRCGRCFGGSGQWRGRVRGEEGKVTPQEAKSRAWCGEAFEVIPVRSGELEARDRETEYVAHLLGRETGRLVKQPIQPVQCACHFGQADTISRQGRRAARVEAALLVHWVVAHAYREQDGEAPEDA